MTWLLQRLWKLLSDTGFWPLVGHLHAALYRVTDGRIGHRTGGFTNLLLTTTGHRSGEPRTVVLAYVRDGEDLLLVASNGGSDRHPAWWLNLEACPRASVQVGDQTLAVEARAADAAERTRLWPMVKAANPFYGMYEQITARTIPVVILRSVAEGVRPQAAAGAGVAGSATAPAAANDA